MALSAVVLQVSNAVTVKLTLQCKTDAAYCSEELKNKLTDRFIYRHYLPFEHVCFCHNSSLSTFLQFPVHCFEKLLLCVCAWLAFS